MNSKQPRISAEVQVMFFDTDCGGVVSNFAYLRFIEIARTLLVEELGLPLAEMAKTQKYPVVVRTEIDYRRAAKYDDDLEVLTRATLLTPVRIRFDYQIVRGDETLVVGHTVHATLDARGRPCRLPAPIREMIGAVQ